LTTLVRFLLSLICPRSIINCFIIDDDYAVSVLASYLSLTSNATFFLHRSLTSPYTLYNPSTGFIEARNADGSWAGEDEGWTEGDKWAYSFDIVHDVGGLIKARGGNASFVKCLDEHFDGGKCIFGLTMNWWMISDDFSIVRT
jgi:putative alpha-1,2-mannosidase